MKYLFILLLGLGFCEEIENQSEIYTINYKSGFDRLSLDNLHFIESTVSIVLFEDIDSGKKYEIKKSKINFIKDSNGNIININELIKAPAIKIELEVPLSTPIYPAGYHLKKAGTLMTIGDFLPLAAIVFVHSNPEIAIVVGLSGYVIKFFAYQEMILAGQKMESKHPEY